MITKGVLFHQDNAPDHLSVVAMAPIVPGSPMGLVLVNTMGVELVGRQRANGYHCNHR